MADQESIFEDGENLQGAIGKALHEQKALLCFISDDGDDATQWEVALLDARFRDKLKANTVALRLQHGSEQAGYLHAVCPVQALPAIVIIFNGQVSAKYQHGQTTFEQLQQQLEALYGPSTDEKSTKPVIAGYIDLPPSEGRMRLPNNAYDHLRTLTQQYVSSGVSGKGLLQIQLKLLTSLNIDLITTTVEDILRQSSTNNAPDLPEEVTNRLLNTPASKMQINDAQVDQSSVASSSSSPSATQAPHLSVRTPPVQQSTSPTRTSQPRATNTVSSPQALTGSKPAESSTNTHANTSAQSQRSEYIKSQKLAEAERANIKSQIEADKSARRESDHKAREEADIAKRRAELAELRKANSTTSNPKHTDVRIQVRLFDGSTIRSAFPAEATISGDVRVWVDREVTQKASAGEPAGSSGQPYNLKLILTPLPNRQIEAGEEDTPLSDLDDVKGSATMVMVPVKGYVESFGSGGGGVAGTVVGGVQGVLGTGVAIAGSAVGMLFGGLGRLIGGGTADVSQHIDVPTSEERSTNPTAGSSARSGHARVRTLGDQRRDEEDESQRRGTQLYNGMGLNVQPRKEDKDDKSKQ